MEVKKTLKAENAGIESILTSQIPACPFYIRMHWLLISFEAHLSGRQQMNTYMDRTLENIY